MPPIIIKVYGFITPVDSGCLERIRGEVPGMDGELSGAFSLEDKLLNICFEGIHFPVAEVLSVIAPYIETGACGKLDYIDLESWTLTRHAFEQGKLNSASRSLNDILEYSGH